MSTSMPTVDEHDAADLPAEPGDAWIVMPAFNEESRLGETLAAVCREFANVVVVDDGSTDATGRVAAEHPVWLLQHMINCGQGAALQTGIEFALGRGAGIIVTFDSDGQHRVEDIARLIEPIRQGRAEVVLGSRFLGQTSGMPLTRWLMLKLAVLFTYVFSRIRVTDTHNGLRAFSADAARQISISYGGMAHASEILDEVRRHGLPFCEVPVHIRYTPGTLAKGQSSWSSIKLAAQLLLGRMIR